MPNMDWRVIFSAPMPGAINMATDEAILLSVIAAKSPPTLRLYAWQPACLSLGVAQLSGEADLARIQENGWQIVRRPSGGRAILHTDELTYSLTALDSNPLMLGGILESYRRLSKGLLAALHALGVYARNDGVIPAGASKELPVCFEVPSDYEIVVNGNQKLVGSAQVRKQNAVLQHGSLPLTGDIARICQALRFESEEERQETAQRVQARATTVTAVLGRQVSWQQAADALLHGFRDALGINFQVGELSPQEQLDTQKLLLEKYNNPEYTFRR